MKESDIKEVNALRSAKGAVEMNLASMKAHGGAITIDPYGVELKPEDMPSPVGHAYRVIKNTLLELAENKLAECNKSLEALGVELE